MHEERQGRRGRRVRAGNKVADMEKGKEGSRGRREEEVGRSRVIGKTVYLDVLPFPLQYVGPVWSAHIGADSAIRGRVEGGWEYVVFGLSSFPLAVCWPCLECPYWG